MSYKPNTEYLIKEKYNYHIGTYNGSKNLFHFSNGYGYMTVASVEENYTIIGECKKLEELSNLDNNKELFALWDSIVLKDSGKAESNDDR